MINMEAHLVLVLNYAVSHKYATYNISISNSMGSEATQD